MKIISKPKSPLWLRLLPLSCFAALPLLATSCRAQETRTIILFDRQPPTLFGTWENNLTLENGALTLRASDEKGGFGDNIKLDASGFGAKAPIIKLTPGAGNKADTFRLILFDAKGATGSFRYSLDGLKAGELAEVSPLDGASFLKPTTVSDKLGNADLGTITRWQIAGDYHDDAIDVAFQSAYVATGDAPVKAPQTVAVAQVKAPADGATVPISSFDTAPTFSYGSWEKGTIENGALRIKTKNNQGGMANVVELDLSGHLELSPQLKVVIAPGNRAREIRFQVLDDKEASSTWTYSLENVTTGQPVVLSPIGGSSLGRPNATDDKKGAADLSRIRSVHIQGNWSGDPLEISVDEAYAAPPSAEVVAAREAETKRLAQQAEQQRLERIALKNRLKRNANSPSVTHVAPVATDVLSVEVQAGRILPSSLQPYVPQAGDTKREIKRKNDGGVNVVVLSRDGKEVGWLIGPKRETLVTYERLEGDPFLTFVADEKDQYSIVSPDDPNYATPVEPTAVSRKSKPNGWALGPGTVAVGHSLYLKMPTPLQTGKKYTLNFGEINTREASTTWTNAPSQIRSEAVHVNQIGYRPTDPAKRAFVSLWMGTGGALKLPDTIAFSVVDDKTGKTVWKGQSSDIWRADKTEKMAREANFSKTDVARLDFSAFQTPGKYRILVDGVGTSYPFEIGEDVWRRAFLIQMKGLYNQRSGMALGPPYTDFVKPRDMHPADGFPVYKTTAKHVDDGNNNMESVLKGATTERVNDAWGGYHDAGDWNPRRVTHMKVTMAQLEVMRMFPAYFSKLDLNIPKAKGVPDILTEAMWEFDTFRRLQQPDGGVGHGIESGLGDPAEGEVSWLNSYPSYVYASDYLNSWYYAAVGARLANLLEPYDAKKAADYRASAIRAFEFADQDFARDKAAGLTAKRGNTWEALDNRNLAAIELYRLTKDRKYHDAFLEQTVLTNDKPDLFQWNKAVQREQAFVYATMPKGMGDEKLKAKAVTATEEMAQRALNYAGNNAWNLTTPDAGKPQFIGFYTGPDAMDLTRAHFLTGKEEYLAGAVRATQFGSGANPQNLVYTTGLGANPVDSPLKLDSKRTGQKAPVGLTPYGIVDFERWNQQWITWPITYIVGKDTQPNAYAWPINESYYDVGFFVAQNEYVVDAWAPNVGVWGYLAARK